LRQLALPTVRTWPPNREEKSFKNAALESSGKVEAEEAATEDGIETLVMTGLAF
jgi:hypothetical protein